MTIRTRLVSRHLCQAADRSGFDRLLRQFDAAPPASHDLGALRTTLGGLGFDAATSDRLIVEAVAEALRRSGHAERPERASAMFLTPSPQEARRYAAAAGDRPVLHCCLAEPDDGALLDWSLLAAPLEPGGVPALVERVGRYWRGEPGPALLWEFVTHGQVMVLQQEP